MGSIQFFFLGIIFYKSLWGCIILQVLLIPYVLMKSRENERKLKYETKLEFKEMLEVFRSAVSAGFSVENAIIRSKKEMELLGYGNGMVAKELDYMIRQMKMHISAEKLFLDWGKRSEIEDIENFAAVFQIARKTGGNLAEIMRDCSQTIGEKIDVEREIETILASRRLEQRIINVVPVFIILYVSLTSKGFLDPLYTGLVGRGIMTLCLLVYLLSMYISRKIMDIEV